MSARRSSAAAALSCVASAGAESPKPRRSTAKTRWCALSSGMSLWNTHQLSGNPWTSSTGAPSEPAET